MDKTGLEFEDNMYVEWVNLSQAELTTCFSQECLKPGNAYWPKLQNVLTRNKWCLATMGFLEVAMLMDSWFAPAFSKARSYTYLACITWYLRKKGYILW